MFTHYCHCGDLHQRDELHRDAEGETLHKVGQQVMEGPQLLQLLGSENCDSQGRGFMTVRDVASRQSWTWLYDSQGCGFMTVRDIAS